MDIFTLGILLFLLAFGTMPFLKADLNDEYYRLIAYNNIPEFVRSHPSTQNMENIDMQMMEIIFHCMSWNPLNRPTIETLKEYVA